jgi:hypothetical protein
VHAAARATHWEALEPIRQAVRERFGRISEKVAQGLLLRHDHGTQYMADDFQQGPRQFAAIRDGHNP